MNHRDYKKFAKDQMYHVYNRGVGKMNIFNDIEDRKVFMFRLWENFHPDEAKKRSYSKPSSYPRRKYLPAGSFDLIAYCLMPNHFHMLVRQNTELSFSNLVSKLCTGYSKYFNYKYSRVGSLFQDQFKSVRVESNEQLLWLSMYIHNNPFKSGITDNPINYEWSSLREYTGLITSDLCNKKIILDQLSKPDQYFKYLEDENDRFRGLYISDGDVLIDND